VTSGDVEQTTETPHAEQQQATSQDSLSATTPSATPIATPSVAAAPAAAPQIHADAIATATATPLHLVPTERRAKRLVVPQIAEIPSLTAPLGVTVGVVGTFGAGDGVIGHQARDGGAGVKTMAVQRKSVQPEAPSDVKESFRTVTGMLAAALAPLVFPMPGSPVDQPVLWAVFAWARRQFERTSFDDRPDLVVNPRQTENIVTEMDADPPGAIVDRIDPETGRVSGRVNVADGEADGLTYALVRPIDPRLGVVTVDQSTGQWTFTPNQAARLIAQLSYCGDVVPFSVAASDGRTVDVRAPIDPAEAVVTDSIEVGDGLTYGLAVVGDRLYVLNGSEAAGNGFVKVIDTYSKEVVGSVVVGSMPFAMAVRGRSLYVGNADDGTVSVIDVGSNAVVDVIDVGGHPFGLEINRDRLYVADHAGTLTVIDLNDNSELVRIAVDGDPFGVAATADRVYVTNYAGGTVAVVDQATNVEVEAVAARDDPLGAGGTYPYCAAVVGGRLYVANSATNALTIIDRSTVTVVDVAPNTRAVDAIPSDASPVDVVVRGDRLYVGNVNSGTVTVMDVATNQPVETIGVGIQPGLMTATADGRTIYVADVMDGTVRVISSVRHAANG
jgi:YVTN family beta-propeller protein